MGSLFAWEFVSSCKVSVNQPSWAVSHFQCPTALVLDEKTVRVYVSCRDSHQVARIGFLDLEFHQGDFLRHSSLHHSPSLSTGGIGCFDEHGVYASSVLRVGDEIKLFYAGYTRGAEYPMFYTSIGTASSKDGLIFERQSKAPLMARSEYDPCLVTSPCIYRIGSKWVMYYVSGFGWFRNERGQVQSQYDIKIAWSYDLDHWHRNGQTAIPLNYGETNISRPTILVYDKVYHMWFCSARNGGPYKIGYAQSLDGYDWNRMDCLSGLDSQNIDSSLMQAYPHVFCLEGHVWMLLNQGRYGDSGFSLLKLRFH